MFIFQRVLDKNDDGDVRTEEWTYGKVCVCVCVCVCLSTFFVAQTPSLQQHFTFGDVAVFAAVNAVVELHGIGKLRTYPKLKEFHDKVASRVSAQ